MTRHGETMSKVRTVLQVVRPLIEGLCVNTARPFSARSARRRRVGASIAAGTLLAAGALGSLPALGNGANGSVFVRTAPGTSGNEPKVPCRFYVDFENF